MTWDGGMVGVFVLDNSDNEDETIVCRLSKIVTERLRGRTSVDKF